MINGVLYHVERDKALRIVSPSQDRKELSAHGGMFGGHLGSKDTWPIGQTLLVARHATGHH